MDIKPSDKTIKQLLQSGKQFVVPRFQREYSWEKKHYQEFIKDMISSLIIEKGEIKIDQYFLGTMLFIGDIAEATDKEILVVDGQQRLTTITILFSAISDIFRSLKEERLSSLLFKYVMTKDDNDKDVRILKSDSHYPFFSFYIQDLTKTNDVSPATEEEECIKETYEYFSKVLKEKALKKLLLTRYGSDIVKNIEYIELLKAIRDQVLNSTVIVISTKDESQANKIFEILNAKGKKLEHVDLIKNKIFELLDETEPADYAEDKWNTLKKTLLSGKESIGLATFYRQFWISKYKKSSFNQLYDDLLKADILESKEICKQFLEDMIVNAKYYMKIINPKLDDYDNKKEYAWLVQSLKVLSDDFNIVQVRVALLAIFDLKNQNLISTKLFKKTIKYLENFHFAFNALLTLRTNKLEGIYSKFAIAARKSKDKTETQSIIEAHLFTPLDELFPTYDAFCEEFIKLYYSKKEKNPSTMKSRYVINKLNCYYAEKEIFESDGSIEHLYPESNGDNALNIGNLILLEEKINNEADSADYKTKVKKYYPKSQYKWLNKFIEENPNWNEDKISDRANSLAETYYYEILERKQII